MRHFGKRRKKDGQVIPSKVPDQAGFIQGWGYGRRVRECFGLLESSCKKITRKGDIILCVEFEKKSQIFLFSFFNFLEFSNVLRLNRTGNPGQQE